MKKKFTSKTVFAVLAVFLSFLLTNVAFGQRDPMKWPFAQNSIWNMPIGSNAVYQPAYLLSVEEFDTSPQYQSWRNAHQQSTIGYGGVGIDDELIIFAKTTDPLRTVHDVLDWDRRCGGASMGFQVRFPAGLVYGDPASGSDTPNYSGGIIQPDGSVFHFNALATCGTDKLGCYDYTSSENNTLTGEGKEGGHGGSGLSGIGGSIRKGELLSGAPPIHHSLKLNILAAAYLVYNNDATPGYRWPAVKADGYANPAWGDWFAYGTANPNKTTATYMEMGVLLAIKPDVTAASLGVTNPLVLKIFQALKDYGAYVVDDTYWNNYDWCMEAGVYEEVQANMDAASYTTQMMTVFKNLNAITNNGPNSIGGGGTPRQPLAPPFGASVSVTGVTVSPTSASLGVNGTQQLTATVAPSNATNKAVTYSSSNTTVATVSTSGLVTGKVAGTATITVTTTDGGKTATSSVTVTTDPTGPIRIMCIGNSLTAEESGYRGVLKNKLTTDGYNVTMVGVNTDADGGHAGFGGFIVGPGASVGDNWNPPYKGNIYDNLTAGYNILSVPCDVIITEIGINDFFNATDANYNPESPAAAKLDGLIGKIFATNPNVKLYVSNLTPIAWEGLNAPSPWSNAIPAIVSKYVGQGRKCYLANVRTGISWNLAADISDDQLHPTTAGYTKMGNYYASLVESTNNTTAVTGVTVSPTTASVAAGATTTLTATVAPSNATNKNVTWSSSNTAVATVSTAGVVTGVAAGSATITVTTTDGAKTATSAITVTGAAASTTVENTATGWSGTGNNYVHANNSGGSTWSLWTANEYVQYTFTGTKVEVYGQRAADALTGNITIDGTAVVANNVSWTAAPLGYQQLIWTSPTLAAGSHTIKIVTNGDYIEVDYLKIYSGTSTTVAVTGVTVSPTTASVATGATTTLTATVAPSNATNQNKSWTSNNTAVATVSTAGVVTGVAAGSATITVTTTDGAKTATCAVTVTSTSVAVTGVTVSPTTASVAVGATTTLTATVAPSNATNKAVTWSSSNTAVATVSTAGVVTGVAAGSATITVTTTSGSKTATCAVTVTAGTVTNLLSTNPSFESETGSSYVNGAWAGITGWNAFNTGYDHIAVTSGSAYAGNNKIEFQFGGWAETKAANRATVTAGSVYNCAFALSKTAVFSTGANSPVTIQVKWFNSAGTLLSSTSSGNLLNNKVTSSWAVFNFNATAPANAVKAGVLVTQIRPSYPNDNLATVVADKFQLTAGTGLKTGLIVSKSVNALTVNETNTESFSVYPNPVTGNVLHLNLSELSGNDDIHISLLDLAGKLVKSEVLKVGLYGKSDITLQLNELNSGAYIVVVESGNKLLRSKIIKN